MNKRPLGRPASSPVLDIQRRLKELSYGDDRLHPLAVDGVFDDNTTRAVIAFQRANDLAPTGRVDYETWLVLFPD